MPLMHRDPAGVAAHHLDDHDAVVRLRRRVQPVDRLRRDRDRGVEAERVVGRRTGRCRSSSARRRPGSRARAWSRAATPSVSSPPIATSASSPLAREGREHLLDAALELVRVRPRRAEDRAAAREDPGDLARPERLDDALDEPAPALAHADHLPAARRATRRVTARMTAFSPGQSPPPVRMPIAHARQPNAIVRCPFPPPRRHRTEVADVRAPGERCADARLGAATRSGRRSVRARACGTVAAPTRGANAAPRSSSRSCRSSATARSGSTATGGPSA